MAAGYDIYVTIDGQPEGAPALSVGLVEAAVLPITPGENGTLYTVSVRTRTAADLVSDPAELVIKLVVQDGVLVARPNSPRITKVETLADGQLAVEWEHDDMQASVEADSFAVYAVPNVETVNRL